MPTFLILFHSVSGRAMASMPTLLAYPARARIITFTNAFLILVSLVAPMGTEAAPGSGSAGDSAKDIWEKSQSMRPEPSMETKLILTKVGNVLYKIPRNYIC
jgi:hypothetical protein